MSGGRHPFEADRDYPPHENETEEEVNRLIARRNERIKNKQSMPQIFEFYLKERSDGSYQLIRQMLNANAEERPTAAQVLQHKYMSVRRDHQVYVLHNRTLLQHSFIVVLKSQKGRELLKLCGKENLDDDAISQFNDLV